MNVRTLVELFDARPLENVLGVEMFRPEQVIYVCPDNTPKYAAEQLESYFAHRGIHASLRFLRVNLFDTRAILCLFRKILEEFPDAVIDITGGTDAVLFAAGTACAGTKIPVITYSRTRNRFYNIQNAPEAHGAPCRVTFTVGDCFRMAGGTMRTGRVDNAALDRYMEDMDPFFSVFMKHRRNWDRMISYIQRISPTGEDGTFPLEVQGAYTVKGERGARLTAPESALQDLEQIRMISELRIDPEESVSFRFRDAQIRAWLRDVGSVLELYVYKACLDSGLFDDVRTSAVVDWRENERSNAVTNELDVMCTQGITPVFISCKTCAIRTEALNELSILKERFGGEIARAAIVSAEPAGASARNRAAELGIRVIDLNDLEAGGIGQSIERLMRSVVRMMPD